MSQEPERVHSLIIACAPELLCDVDNLIEAFVQGVFKGEFERSQERWPSKNEEDFMIWCRYPLPEDQRQVRENKKERALYPVGAWSILDWLRTHDGLPDEIDRYVIYRHSKTQESKRTFLLSMATCDWSDFPPGALDVIRNIFIQREDFCSWLRSCFGFVPASLIRASSTPAHPTEASQKQTEEIPSEENNEPAVESYHVNFIQKLKDLGLKEYIEKNPKFTKEFKDIFLMAYKNTPNEEIQGFNYVKLSDHIARIFMKGYSPGTIRGYVYDVKAERDAP